MTESDRVRPGKWKYVFLGALILVACAGSVWACGYSGVTWFSQP